MSPGVQVGQGEALACRRGLRAPRHVLRRGRRPLEARLHQRQQGLHALEVGVVPSTAFARDQLAAVRAAKDRLPALRWLMVARDTEGRSTMKL